MNKTKGIVCIILVVAVLFTAITALAVELRGKDSAIVTDEEEYGFADPVYPMNFTALSSFFEENTYENDKSEWEYINPYYEEYPRTENTSNFHSHATAVYENVNGATVMVDTLYRQYKEALNDPNYSCGMLIYQCIQYKIAHPEVDVDISFSSFRISPTAAVCLDPNSPYFGYMRSLYDADYDSNGFVRVVYLLLEAARMGIDVTIVGQLNAYAVKQYNNETGKTYSKAEPSYIKYFNKGMEYECYEKYAPGDTVADHMTFRPIEWDYADKKSMEVMHVKTCAVTAYRDKDGVDHDYGVWFSSTNLDANNYMGHNGNGGSQAGVIVTGHEAIYNATKNYVALMGEYCKQEDIFEFRNLATTRTEEQIKAILDGKEDEIPYDERIVYLGSETDDIFELYFTPLSGEFDTWNTELNPYCKYLQEFYDSEDEDVVLSWNNPNFLEDFFVSRTCVEAIYNKFVTNKREGNRLGIRCQNGTFEGISSLKKGTDLEFFNFTTKWNAVHDKDIMLSYVKDGKRQYVSFLSSCNFNYGALYYQTNQILIIKETDETGNVAYASLGNASSKGVITKDDMFLPEAETESAE